MLFSKFKRTTDFALNRVTFLRLVSHSCLNILVDFLVIYHCFILLYLIFHRRQLLKFLSERVLYFDDDNRLRLLVRRILYYILVKIVRRTFLFYPDSNVSHRWIIRCWNKIAWPFFNLLPDFFNIFVLLIYWL